MILGGIVSDIIQLHSNIKTRQPSRKIRCFQGPTERMELESTWERTLDEFPRKNMNGCTTQRLRVPWVLLRHWQHWIVTGVIPADIIISVTTE